jgi:Tfp pilus assembly PilM family ATPase
MDKFNLEYKVAAETKIKYGLDLSEKQTKMISALSENLQFLISEIKKIIRYFEERDKNQNVKIEQIIVLGGGANLPGFSTYLTSELRIPTRLASIWENIGLGHVKKPSHADNSMYATAMGLALIDPREAAK